MPAKGINKVRANIRRVLQPVELSDLLSQSFLSKHTKFKDVSHFFEVIGTTPSSMEEMEALEASGKLDKAVAAYSSFTSWQELFAQAVQDLSQHRLSAKSMLDDEEDA